MNADMSTDIEKRSKIFGLQPLADPEQENLRRLILSGQKENIHLALQINLGTKTFEKLYQCQQKIVRAKLIRTMATRARESKRPVSPIDKLLAGAGNHILAELGIRIIPLYQHQDRYSLIMYVVESQKVIEQIKQVFSEGY